MVKPRRNKKKNRNVQRSNPIPVKPQEIVNVEESNNHMYGYLLSFMKYCLTSFNPVLLWCVLKLLNVIKSLDHVSL